MFLETQTDLSLFPGNITLFLFIWIRIRQFQEFKTLQGPESFVMHRGKKNLHFDGQLTSNRHCYICGT